MVPSPALDVPAANAPSASGWALDFAPPKQAATDSAFLFAQQVALGNQRGWSAARWSGLFRDAWARQDEARLWELLQAKGMAFQTSERVAEMMVLAKDAIAWAQQQGVIWTPLLDALDSRTDWKTQPALRAHLDAQPAGPDPATTPAEIRAFRSSTLRRWLATRWGAQVPDTLFDWVAAESHARRTLLEDEAVVTRFRPQLLDAALNDAGHRFSPTEDRPEGYRIMNTPTAELQRLVHGGLPAYAQQAIMHALTSFRSHGRTEDVAAHVAWRALLLQDPTLTAAQLAEVGPLVPKQTMVPMGAPLKDLPRPAKGDLEFFVTWSSHPGWGPPHEVRWLEAVRDSKELAHLFRRLLLTTGSATSQRGQIIAPLLATIRQAGAGHPVIQQWITDLETPSLPKRVVLEHPLFSLAASGLLAEADTVRVSRALQLLAGTDDVRRQMASSPAIEQSGAVARVFLDPTVLPAPEGGAAPLRRDAFDIGRDRAAAILNIHASALPVELITSLRDRLWASWHRMERTAKLRELLPGLCAPGGDDQERREAMWRPWLGSEDPDQRLIAVEAFRHLRALATPPKPARRGRRP